MARNCGSIYVFSPLAYQNQHSVIEGFIVPVDGTNLELQYSGFDRSAQAPRFQFMVGASVAKKSLKLTYIHAQKRNATVLEANLAVDPRNKVVGKYSFNTNTGSLKYSYVHSSGATFEPSYDFQTEAWHFAASRKVGSHDSARVCYDAHASTIGMEWTRDSKEFGQFKIIATVPTDTSKTPKLVAEKTWSVDF